MSKTVTLISAWGDDPVHDECDAVELAEVDGSGILSRDAFARLTALPEVQKFFADNGYGPDNPDELMYLTDGKFTSARYPTLTVTLPD